MNTKLLDFYCGKYDIVIIYDFAINMIFQIKFNFSEQIKFQEIYNTRVILVFNYTRDKDLGLRKINTLFYCVSAPN